MYSIGNKTFTDAGKYLKKGNSVGYTFINDGQEIVEEDMIIDDMHIDGFLLFWSNNKIAQKIIKNGTYADYKKALIQKKYSNDDQIAIILNKDDSDRDRELYDKMQQWREWSSILAKKIIDLLQQNV